MKKILLLMSVFVIGLSASAQITTNSSCDTNLNGTVSIEDVTNVANKIIGKASEEKEVVTAEQVNATLKDVKDLLTNIKNDHQEVLDRLRSLENAGVYTSDYANGHKFVDLGLPSGTLWATCNVGASSPEEYGDYFAWGETEPQADNAYSWASYSLCKGSSSTMTKYCQQSSYGYNGFTDSLIELESSDDAATVNWGSDWQMPNWTQLGELYNSSNTTTEWTTVNGVYGRKITSKKSGYTDRYIFLPAAGCRKDGSLCEAGSAGLYWSRSLGTSTLAYDLIINSSKIAWFNYSRYYGHSVRPVRVK